MLDFSELFVHSLKNSMFKQIFLCDCFHKGKRCPTCAGSGCLLCEYVGIYFTPCSTCKNQHLLLQHVPDPTGAHTGIAKDSLALLEGYQTLESIVDDQGTKIEDICHYVEDVKVATDAARKEIHQAGNYQRWVWKGMLVTGVIVSGLLIGPLVIVALF